MAPLLDFLYRLVASHRSVAMAVTRLLWGGSVLAPTYGVANALFLRLLGLCFLAAFVSLWVQVDGLVGARGILPVAEFLDWVRAQTGAGRYWTPADALLDLSERRGAAPSVRGRRRRLAAPRSRASCPPGAPLAAWVLYLSLSVAGQTFLEFQWDILLTETGLLADLPGLAAAPARPERPRRRRASRGSCSSRSCFG